MKSMNKKLALVVFLLTASTVFGQISTTLSTPLGSNLVNYSGSGIYHNKVMIADALKGSSDAQIQNWKF